MNTKKTRNDVPESPNGDGMSEGMNNSSYANERTLKIDVEKGAIARERSVEEVFNVLDIGTPIKNADIFGFAQAQSGIDTQKIKMDTYRSQLPADSESHDGCGNLISHSAT